MARWPFQPEHDELRASIRAFVEKELGITITIKQQEFAQFLEFLGPPPNRSVDVYRLGWVGDMSTGLIVEAGDPVATVVPDGELQVVAELPVREAVGRVRTGQAVRSPNGSLAERPIRRLHSA